MGSPTVVISQPEGITGALEVGPRHDQLRASHFTGPTNDAVEVVWMPLLPMVSASEDGICQVDANLQPFSGQPGGVGEEENRKRAFASADRTRHASMYRGAYGGGMADSGRGCTAILGTRERKKR